MSEKQGGGQCGCDRVNKGETHRRSEGPWRVGTGKAYGRPGRLFGGSRLLA